MTACFQNYLALHCFLLYLVTASWVSQSRLPFRLMFLKKLWMALLQSDPFQWEHLLVERFVHSSWWMKQCNNLGFYLFLTHLCGNLLLSHLCGNLLQVEKQCAHFFGVTINEQQAESGIVVRVTSTAQSKFKVSLMPFLQWLRLI